jgi:hypothetical protein
MIRGAPQLRGRWVYMLNRLLEKEKIPEMQQTLLEILQQFCTDDIIVKSILADKIVMCPL